MLLVLLWIKNITESFLLMLNHKETLLVRKETLLVRMLKSLKKQEVCAQQMCKGTRRKCSVSIDIGVVGAAQEAIKGSKKSEEVYNF